MARKAAAATVPDRLWFSPYVVLTERQTRAVAARGRVPGLLAAVLLERVVVQCDEAVRFAHGAMMTKPRRKRRA